MTLLINEYLSAFSLDFRSQLQDLFHDLQMTYFPQCNFVPIMYTYTHTHTPRIEVQMGRQMCERETGNLTAKILTFVCGNKRVEFLFIYGKIINNCQISFPSKLKKSYSNSYNNYHWHSNLWKHNNITKYHYYITNYISNYYYYTPTSWSVSYSDIHVI